MRLLAITLVLSASAAAAQPAPPTEPAPGVDPAPAPTPPTPPPTPQQTSAGKPGKRFAIDGALVIPLSDYADEASVGFGAFGRLELPRSDTFSLTLRAGALVHVAANDRDTLFLVPVFFGLQWAFADPWFISVDGGISFRYAGEGAGALGLAFGFGYRKNRFAVRGEFLVPDLGVADSTAGALLTVGYAL